MQLAVTYFVILVKEIPLQYHIKNVEIAFRYIGG